MPAAATMHDIFAAGHRADLDQVVQLAILEPQVHQELLAGLVSKEDTYRYKCLEAVLRLAAARPDLVYPDWDRFPPCSEAQSRFTWQ